MLQAPIEVLTGKLTGAALAERTGIPGSLGAYTPGSYSAAAGVGRAKSDHPGWLSEACVDGHLVGIHLGTLSSQRVTGRLADWWADAVLYQRLIGAHIRAQMQYRVSFLLMTLVRMLATGSEVVSQIC